MERQHSRRNSTSSVHSQSNSANIQCSEQHTHAVVRREKDDKVILVPLNNFINFGKTVKVNEIATYKGSADSRKSDRGKVLIFGTEDLCVEQLQVLQEEIIEEPSPEKQIKHTNSSMANSNNIHHEEHIINTKKKPNDKFHEEDKENHAVNHSTGSKRSSKLNEIDDDRSRTLPTKKINSTNILASNKSSTCQVKKPVQVKRKLFHNSDEDNDIEELSTNKNTFDEEDEDSGIPISSTKQKSKKVPSHDSPVIEETRTNNLQNSRKSLTPKVFSNETQSKQVDKSVNRDSNTDDTSSSDEDNDEENISDFVSKTKYNKLQRKLQKEKNKVLVLEKRISYYKKNYMPLPDGGARAYFLKVAKLLSSTLNAADVYEHAKRINNINPNTLLGCIRDTGTHTTRNIINKLFTPDELISKAGPEAVSKLLRKNIRNFVEAHHGPFSNDRPFNEAINGVFRQAKEDKDGNEGSIKPISKKRKSTGKQLTIDNMISSKKSKSNNTNKTTTMTNSTQSLSDDD
ncbi:hypothetical protein I4U23_005332 [Adineta vaga]|nr:hypothetical protein I4U23_005332 [Adineta vaga]